MSFAKKLENSHVVKIGGDVFIPPGYQGETAIIIPDEIVEDCISRFGLTNQTVVLDPMCGVGTIVRVLNANDVNCRGIEMDEDRFISARSVVNPRNLSCADFLTARVSRHKFDCIFTSLPFAWFKDPQALALVSPRIAMRFKECIKKDGFLLIDSMPRVEREGNVWPVSELENKYFTENGFYCSEVVSYDSQHHIDSNNRSIITKFEYRDPLL